MCPSDIHICFAEIFIFVSLWYPYLCLSPPCHIATITSPSSRTKSSSSFSFSQASGWSRGKLYLLAYRGVKAISAQSYFGPQLILSTRISLLQRIASILYSAYFILFSVFLFYIQLILFQAYLILYSAYFIHENISFATDCEYLNYFLLILSHFHFLKFNFKLILFYIQLILSTGISLLQRIASTSTIFIINLFLPVASSSCNIATHWVLTSYLWLVSDTDN